MRLTRTIDRKLAIALGAWAGYALGFAPLYRLVGPIASLLALLPIFATCWRFGTPGGLLTGALTLPANLLLLCLAGGQTSEILSVAGLVGSAAILLIGGVVGRLHDLREQLNRELTERERVEETLRDSKQRYSTLVDMQGEGVGIVDTEEHFVFANPAAHEIFGVPEGTLVGRSLREFTDERSFETIQAQTKRRRQGRRTTYEVAIRRPDGEERSLLVTATTRVDAEGQFVGSFGVFRDITERKRAERALQENEVRFRELFDRMTRGVAIYDVADGGETFLIKELNKAAEEINQVDRCEVLGRPAQEVFPSVGSFRLRDVLQRVWRTGEAEHHPAAQYQDDCISLWVENYVFKLQSGELVAVHDDVTQQRQAEAALQRQNRQLSQLNAISRALSSSLELEETLDEALSCTLDMLQFRSGLVALREDDHLKLVTHTGVPARLVQQLEEVGLKDTLCEFVYREGRPITIRDLAQASPVAADDLLQVGFRSTLGTPIIHKGEILGVLCAFDAVPYAGNGSTQALLQAIGQQIGVAVDNARLFEDVLKEREIAQILLNTAQTLSTTLRFEPLVERVLTALSRVVSYDTASVSLVQGDYCQTVASRGGDAASDGHRFLLKDRPFVRRVVEERRPIIVPQSCDALQYSIGDAVDSIPSWLGVPLVARDKVVGVLTMGSHSAGVCTEETAQLVSAFAHQTALAIENSRLYEQTRSQLREVTVLQGVTAAISATLDVDQVLPYVARSLCGILNSTSVEIYSLEEDGQVAVAVAAYAAQEANAAEQTLGASTRMALGDFPDTAEALAQNRPLQVPIGLVGDSDLDRRRHASLEVRQAQAMLLLPIVTRERALGFAQVWDSTGPRRFSEGEVATGQTLIHQTAIAMENTRLLQESQRRARQLAGAARVAQHAAAITEREHLLDVVVNLIQEQFGYRRSAVFLVDAVDEQLHPAAATEDFWRIIPEGYRQPMGRGAIGTAAARGETVLVGDASNHAIAYRVGEWLSPSSLSVPIQIGGLVIGVLEVEADTVDAFDESDQLALEIVADQIAIAYQNAELLTQTRSRMQELRLLHDVSLAAASSTHLQETLQAAGEALASEWPGTQIALQLIDDETQTLRLKAGVGYHRERAKSLDMPLGQGITGWVAQHSMPVLAPDVREDPRYYEASPETRSELCVPLTLGGQVIGTLNVESPQVQAFNLDDQRLLSTLASNLAVLIERARLFEEIEATRATLEERAEALEEANARLKELDRLKSQFLANVSHELRTPLNSVIGFSEVLLDGLLGEMPPEHKECVENIYASGEHLMALINDVLDLSKIEAGRMELAPAPFDVMELIENVRKTVTPMIKDKSQVLKIEVADDLPTLTADRIRLRQVLLNLLSNAHKFTPAEGEITLSCRVADPSTMLFSVEDTGIGIKAEDHEIIFEEFRQADGSSMREAEGTGLGLTISKRLVELHNGSIWVESGYGEGATFSFLLPIEGPSPEEQQAEGEALRSLSGQGVLIVEDDRHFSNLLALYLRKEGYNPIQHYQGTGVLDRARDVNPALITLDVMLPGEDGWQVLQQLKSDPQTRDIPVLVISALRNGELALSLGATDYLVKPLDQDTLHRMLSRFTKPEPASRRAKILVIDDDPDLVPLLQVMLRDNDYTLLSAYDGESGLTMARTEHPDGILLDLMMPGLSGFEVLDRLRAADETADTPVIVLTVKDVTREEQARLNDQIQTLMHKSALTPQGLVSQLRALKRQSHRRFETQMTPSLQAVSR